MCGGGGGGSSRLTEGQTGRNTITGHEKGEGKEVTDNAREIYSYMKLIKIELML